MKTLSRCRPTGHIDRFRRSNDDVLSRAKKKTLWMTVTIVIVFVVCWTPYNVICFWFWLDKDTLLKTDQRVQKLLYLFACTNSCMNPIVYGLYNIPRRQTAKGPGGTHMSLVGVSFFFGVDCLRFAWPCPRKCECCGGTFPNTRHARAMWEVIAHSIKRTLPGHKSISHVAHACHDGTAEVQ